MAYMIYGSYKGGRFKAMDMTSGVQTNKLIYATVINQHPDTLRDTLKELNDNNPDWQFKLREVK